MSQTVSTETPKKRGFLKILWIIFIFFLIIILLFTGFFYWQRPLVTGWFLHIYATRLASVLTSHQHYQYNEDSTYIQQLNEKKATQGFSEEIFRENFLNIRRQEVLAMLLQLVQAYRLHPEKNWIESLKELDSELQRLLDDQKITPQEFTQILEKIQIILTKN